MKLTIITSKTIIEKTLPAEVKGFFSVPESRSPAAFIEGFKGRWYLRPEDGCVLETAGRACDEAELLPGAAYTVKRDTADTIHLFADTDRDGCGRFSRYLIRDCERITVGRAPDNDICCSFPQISSYHAEILLLPDQLLIRDLESTNGTFVNGDFILSSRLTPGSVIFIAGLKIVVSGRILAIGDVRGSVRLSDHLLPIERISAQIRTQTGLCCHCVNDRRMYSDIHSFFAGQSTTFDCAVMPRIPVKESFKIDSPPRSPVFDELPWPLIIGSSASVSMISLITLISAIISGNTYQIMIGVSLLCGMLIFPTLTKVYERRRRRKKELLRRERYTAYLDEREQAIEAAVNAQTKALRRIYPPPAVCVDQLLCRGSRFAFPHGESSADLSVRLGTGDIPALLELGYEEEHFNLEDDILRDEMYKLAHTPRVLEDVPVCMNLKDHRIIAVSSAAKTLNDFSVALLIGLASHYSVRQVRIAVIAPDAPDALRPFRHLPHTESPDRSLRMTAFTQRSARLLAAHLSSYITAETQAGTNTPHLIIVCFEEKAGPSAWMSDLLDRVLRSEHASAVYLSDCSDPFPDIRQALIRITDEEVFTDTAEGIRISPDAPIDIDPQLLSHCFARMNRDSKSSDPLPDVIDILSLFGTDSADRLNFESIWHDNDPSLSLEAPLGLTLTGDLLSLDLHEHYHGPHALIAGMTGSGKSELLITFILSLSVKYSPEDVAFILIDYKGGGTSGSLRSLPHIAGVVTNLDGPLIRRSIMGIESELRRRQAIFAGLSEHEGISGMDIYRYQRLYREGKISDPLPHLFIIADEFAELKADRPEFMDKLTSAARIGRSLGIHLILATQKPSGVVDDQIWSNARTRICLKVQDRSDSMEMIKCSDGAELSGPGSFILQVGNNEIFRHGRCAWAGAAYVPQADRGMSAAPEIRVLSDVGAVIKKRSQKKLSQNSACSQKDALIRHLDRAVRRAGVRIQKVISDPLPEKILLGEPDPVQAKNLSTRVPIGFYDNPEIQQLFPLYLDITSENTLIYGPPGSGKSTLLTTLLCSLIRYSGSQPCCVYILDFDRGMMKVFEKAAIVGDVMLPFEEEKVIRFFERLKELPARRQMKMSDDFFPPIPIITIISGYPSFRERFEDLDDELPSMIHEGAAYGLRFILCAARTDAVRYRLAQSFERTLILSPSDRSAVSAVFGTSDAVIPEKICGRGLVKLDKIYEFQTASIADTDEYDRISLHEHISRLIAKHGIKAGFRSPAIPVMPSDITLSLMEGYISCSPPGMLPVGIRSTDLNAAYADIFKNASYLITSADDEHEAVILGLAALAQAAGIRTVAVDELIKDTKMSETTVYEANDERLGLNPNTLAPTLFYAAALPALLPDDGAALPPLLAQILSLADRADDVGFVIGGKAQRLRAYSREKWFSSYVSSSDGIWVGPGFSDQYLLHAEGQSYSLGAGFDSDYGLVITSGKAAAAKLFSLPSEPLSRFSTK